MKTREESEQTTAVAQAKVDVEIKNIGSVSPEDAETARKVLLGLGEDVLGCRVDKGPRVVRMALELRNGVPYSRITDRANSLLLDLRKYPARIEAPIPGHDLVGIEFPCTNPKEVKFSDFVGKEWYVRRKESVRKAMYLPVVFGKDVDGNVVVEDLASMPHMLVGGASGQGAPQFLHSVICGLVATRTPEEVQFIIADPRCVEFASYAKLPHLVVPVINDIRKVVFSLRWAVAEMEKRLKMFARARTRDIADFNSRDMNPPSGDMFGDDTPMSDFPATVPYVVIVISDFDDVMEKIGEEILSDIQRLTAKARAAGIHLVLETELPDKDVLPDALMADVPVRVAFRTASEIDSMVVLGNEGAESLIGGGDALVRGRDGMVRRVQTPSIPDAEVDALAASMATSTDSRTACDPMLRKDYRRAYEVVVKTQRASTSHLQRHLGIGYRHAASLIDELERNGAIGPQNGMGPRKVLVDTLSEPQLSEVEMKVRLSFDELNALRQLAKERHCEADDIVSQFVHERLAAKPDHALS